MWWLGAFAWAGLPLVQRKEVVTPVLGQLTELKVADVGPRDVLVGRERTGAWLFAWTGSDWSETRLVGLGDVHSVVDLDGDGIDEVVTLGAIKREGSRSSFDLHAVVWRWTGTTFAPGPEAVFPGKFAGFIDIDGDGVLDLATGGPSTWSGFRYHQGAFGGSATSLSHPGDVLGVDIDRDGVRDVVQATLTHQIWHLQSGESVIERRPAAATVDLDGSGGLDQILFGGLQGRFTWIQMGPDGQGAVRVVQLPSSVSDYVGAADADGDRLRDLWFHDGSAAFLFPFLGKGFGSSQRVALCPKTTEVAVADVDGDELADLIAYRPIATSVDTREIRLLLSGQRGSGTSCVSDPPVPREPEERAPGLFDGGTNDSSVATLDGPAGKVEINVRDGVAGHRVIEARTGGGVAMFTTLDAAVLSSPVPVDYLGHVDLVVWHDGKVRGPLRQADGAPNPRTEVKDFAVASTGAWIAVNAAMGTGGDCGRFVERPDGRDRFCMGNGSVLPTFSPDGRRAVLYAGKGILVVVELPDVGPAVSSKATMTGVEHAVVCGAASARGPLACVVRLDGEEQHRIWFRRPDGVVTVAGFLESLPGNELIKVDVVRLANSLDVDSRGVTLHWEGGRPRGTLRWDAVTDQWSDMQ